MPPEAETTYVTADDLGIGLALCCDPRCHCAVTFDTATTEDVEARLHWWLASDADRGDC